MNIIFNRPLAIKERKCDRDTATLPTQGINFEQIEFTAPTKFYLSALSFYTLYTFTIVSFLKLYSNGGAYCSGSNYDQIECTAATCAGFSPLFFSVLYRLLYYLS